MADGSGEFVGDWRIVDAQEAGRMQLKEALAAGHVVAHCCRCECVEPADTSWWRKSKADLASHLSTLSHRVRCVCGSKDVDLKVWPVEPFVRHPRTYIWRA